MIQIYPSILENNINIFKNRLQQYITLFDYFQIDIADGIFVNNRTIQIEQLMEHGTWNMEHGNQIKNKAFEMHLIVKDWQAEIPKIDRLSKLINIKLILIHLQNFNVTCSMLNASYAYGIVLNPEDDVEKNIELIKQFPVCQLMTIHPGRQGNPFIPEVLDKIEQLRKLSYKGKILLDGAINDKTMPIVLSKKYLPDAVCPGSYFHDNPKEKLTRLQEIIKMR